MESNGFLVGVVLGAVITAALTFAAMEDIKGHNDVRETTCVQHVP